MIEFRTQDSVVVEDLGHAQSGLLDGQVQVQRFHAHVRSSWLLVERDAAFNVGSHSV